MLALSRSRFAGRVLFVALLAFQPQAFAAAGGMVVVPKPGQQALSRADLKALRLGVIVRWASYHKIKVKEPNGEMLEYLQPQPTRSRLLRAPLDEETTFSLGEDLLVSLQPKRWEQDTQRFSLKVEVNVDQDRVRETKAASQTVLMSGLLQKPGAQSESINASIGIDWVFVGEERFGLYDSAGELVADFSLGTIPEVSEILPATAQKDGP